MLTSANDRFEADACSWTSRAPERIRPSLVPVLGPDSTFTGGPVALPICSYISWRFAIFGFRLRNNLHVVRAFRVCRGCMGCDWDPLVVVSWDVD